MWRAWCVLAFKSKEEEMAYDAKAIANRFLDIAKKENVAITPMKLQKLIFFAHGWNYGLYDEPLIVDPVQAWQFGPVVPSIYHEFKHAGSGAITDRATDFDLENFELVEPEVPSEDKRTLKLIDRVWSTYGRRPAVDLSNITHLPDSPWHKTWARHPGTRDAVISDTLIRDHYKALVQKNNKTANENA